VITGTFSSSQEGSFVFLPVDVPAGQTSVRIKYCYDQPELPTNQRIKHTLDIGLYQPRAAGHDIWAKDEFRGWSGSNISDFTVSPEGPSPASGRGTTRGYEPGAIPAGQWAVELGLASVVGQDRGDLDGKVNWRVEVDWGSDAADSNEPYSPVAYDSTPADPDPGWYSGDFHVHALNSGDAGSATYRKVFGYSFCPDPALGSLCDPADSKPDAGLDFITVNDHNNGVSWGQIGGYQADYPGHLAIRSEEVTTYRGHFQNHGSADWIDYRTGTLYTAALSGAAGSRTLQSLNQVRPPTTPGSAGGPFDQIHAGNGWTQVNHPTIFPSAIPGFSELCRGCPWDYSNAETDFDEVDSIEVSTGPAGLRLDPLDPGPNPFTPLALQFYESALDQGNHIAAVGGSDSHSAGEVGDITAVTDAAIGTPTTVVYAPELSEQGIKQGVTAGHTYVKLFAGDGPDIRLEAVPSGTSGTPAIMGDTVAADAVDFTARVTGAGPAAPRPGPYVLLVLKDGLPFLAAPVTSDDFTYPFASSGPGRYRIQVMRLSGVAAIEDVSSPIYVEPAGPPPPATSADLSVTQSDAPDPLLRGDEVAYTVSVHNAGQDPAVGANLSDVLPQGFGFVSANAAGGTCDESGGVVNCDLGDLSSGATRTVTIRASADRVGKAGNVAIAHAGTSDPDGENNSDTEETTVLRTGACSNPMSGDNGSNRLYGTFAGDSIHGRRGDDTIKGRGGRDCLFGERGADTIRSRDGERDVVSCGRGNDVAVADGRDSVRGCETVRLP
jgi:uncharacterized repeat protein (TIGR01451 family)